MSTPSSKKILAEAVRFNFTQQLLNPFNLGFALGLPMIMYLMFGANQKYSQVSVGNGNVAALVLVNMTFYGIVGALSAIGSTVALERQQAWLRQMAVTPLGAGRYIMSKILAALGVGAVIAIFCLSLGSLTGAKMTAGAWAGSALMVILVAAPAAALGLGAALWVRSDGAFALNSGILTISAFISGIFIPLDSMGSFFQKIAPWSPLYGMGAVAKSFLFGQAPTSGEIVNLCVWTAVFIGIALTGARRRANRM